MATTRVDYFVIRYVSDSVRGTSFPVGLAYRKTGEVDFHFRLPAPDEKLPYHVPELEAFSPSFLAKLRGMLSTGTVPYSDAEPFTSDWWSDIRRLLIHRITIDEPHQVVVENPEFDMELQFEALVQPLRSSERDDFRIDTMLNESLGSLAARFQGHSTVAGYQGRDVRVLKRVDLGARSLVIDAVNLTIREPETALEAMLHRATELIHYSDSPVEVMLGYYASPEGLNGEAKLVALGERIIGRPLLNLAHFQNVQGAVRDRLESLISD